MKVISKKEAELNHKARNLSIKEGVFTSVKTSLGDYYIQPFAIAINSSNSLVAMFGAVAGLLGPLSQTFGSRLIEKYSRKKIILKAIFLEALMWLPLIAIAFLYINQILTDALPLLALLTFSIYIMLANIGYPAWFSWMGDIVEGKFRGRFFSKRDLLVGFTAAIIAIASSFFLDFMKQKNLLMAGFIIFFSLALLGRIIAWRVFKKQHEPKIKINQEDHFSFWDFVLKSPSTNFGKYSIFRALLGFAIAISSPLTTVYLLRYLELSYSKYMIIVFAGTIFSLFLLELWGKISDRFGNYRVLCLTTILIPLTPILWILSTNTIYLIFVPSTIGGIAWAGFMLASGNFIYDNVRIEKRGLAISYFNLLTGIGIFLGAGLGALLIKFLKTDFMEPLILIFIIGAIARMIVVFLWIPKIREVKKTEKFKGTKTIKELFIKDLKPTISEEFHQIMSIRKYLETK